MTLEQTANNFLRRTGDMVQKSHNVMSPHKDTESNENEMGAVSSGQHLQRFKMSV